MKVLIVTGGIGSGKSQVCKMLEQSYGIPVYEADSRAKLLYSEVPGMLEALEASLGAGLRDENGGFFPQKLAQIIFSDSGALKKVEDILFPAMMDDFESWANRSGKEVVAFESATILEKPQFDGFGDIVLLVDAPVNVRLARASQRDGVADEKILDRMRAQKLMNRLSQGETIPRIDHRIVNDSTLEDLSEKLADFIGKYGLTKML